MPYRDHQVPKVSKADKEKRLDKTTELLAFHTHDEVCRRLMTLYRVKKATAVRWINQVHNRILQSIRKPREEWLADTLHQLNQIIRTDPERRLEALKQRTGLLGLNAPTKVRLTVEGMYQGADQWRALGDPAFLQQALALDIEFGRLKVTANGNEQGNGGGAPPRAPRTTAQQLRLFGLPSIPISASPPSAPGGGVEFTFPSGPASPAG